MVADDFTEISKTAMETIRQLVKREPLGVIGITKVSKGWEASVDVLERKAIPDTQDIIGNYLLTFDGKKELTGYKIVERRRRGDVGEEVEEEKRK